MNTKFPINGRYTTLGDLIHEYAKYSSYPDASKNNTYTGTGAETFNDIYLWNYQEQSMPFVQLIYNGNPANEQKALYPYSVVWFDNVYGDHIDPKTRRMQIVQTQDSSTLNFYMPITADSIKNKDAIKDGQFMFRFIIPDKVTGNSDHFYYNYRTANNEAVVMYALRNLLEITKDKKFYFGELNTATSEPKYRILNNECTHTLKFKYSYKKVNNKNSQATTVFDQEQTVQGTVTEQESAHTREQCKNKLASGGVFKFNPTNDTECEFSISTTVFDGTFFQTIDVSGVLPFNTEAPADDLADYTTYTLTEFKFIAWNSFDTDPLPDDDSEELISRVSAGTCLPLFNIDDDTIGIKERLCLFDINGDEIVSLKPDAYKYLGNYFWTLMYVQHNNYTSIVKYHEGVNQNGVSIIDESRAIYKSTETDNGKTFTHYDLHNYIRSHPVECIKKNGNIKSGLEMLTDLAHDMAAANDATTDKTNRNNKYLRNGTNNYAKALYFLTLFVNSQRFFVSHITSFEYVNISNKSYALREPLLRCDLGLFQIIESITITKAVQTVDTILPPWSLDADTKIDIAITYRIKYKDIPQLKDGNSILSFTLKDFWNIKDNDNTPDEEGKIKRWVRLVQPGSYGEVSKGIISKENVSDNENPDFGATDAFGTNHFLQPIDKNQPSYSDCSLGTLKWPLNDTDLEVQDERTLKLLAGNTSDENNYASTANSTTFGSKSWDDLKDDNYAPFGYLRIFDYLDSKQIDSSFIINVPILRCKNWWFTEAESTSIDTAEICSYFDPIYTDAQIAEPKPKIGIYTNSYAYGNDGSNIQNIINMLNKLPIAAPTLIGSEMIKQYFGTKIGRAKKWIYASGASELDPNSKTEQIYNSTKKLYFETMNSTLGAWILRDSIEYIDVHTNNSRTVSQYSIKKDYRTQTTGIYTIGRLYIDVDENGKPKDDTKCFYFKITNANHTDGDKIKVNFLKYSDSLSKPSSGELKLGFTQHDNKITASFIIYNYNPSDLDVITGIGTSTESKTLTINLPLSLGNETNDITIIDNEYNNFVLSSIESAESYLLTKHHDSNDRENLLHLFHYGLDNSNNPIVIFKNPTKMFEYDYPGIITDDDTVSVQPSISLGSKFINRNNTLTSDRTLYFALNNIFAFLHLSNSTIIDSGTDVDPECPTVEFQHDSIDYIATTGQQQTFTLTTAKPGAVLSFVTNDLILTTKNIKVSTGVLLSKFLTDLNNNNKLIKLIVSIYQFVDSDIVDTTSKSPTTFTITEKTKDDYALMYLNPNTLTILTYNIKAYKNDTSSDVFTVNIATAGWRGTTSNIQIHCIAIPKPEGGYNWIGQPTKFDISSDDQAAILRYKYKFPNKTDVYISVPNQEEVIGDGGEGTKYNKHTGWDVDGSSFGNGAPQYIKISNTVTGSSVLLSSRTVYAIFNDSTTSGGGSTPIQTYTVTVNSGNFKVEGISSSYNSGDTVTFSVTADEGYTIKTVTGSSGISISNTSFSTYSFTMPAQNVIITVTTEAVSTS